LAADFIRQMARDVRVNHGAAAVLVPSSTVGQQAEAGLTQAGLKARFMRGAQLDLKSDDVKVLTLQAAKGLEFPVVVVAGLSAKQFPRLPADMDPEERQEELQTARRTLYVGLTRSMRRLLVLYARKQPSPLVTELADHFWDKVRQPVEG
ncbi:MAG TPA: 3'-5' exonuclease, partial [Symbiobacteriaceae bacterium]|nr:3'-5' exonuclease [Symbiobacteriaceae bacterium]